MGKKRGRPPKFVKDPKSGNPVVGLSMDANCYYYSFWRNEGFKKRPNFGPSGVENFCGAHKLLVQFVIAHKGGEFTAYDAGGLPPNPTSHKTTPGGRIVEWDDISPEDTTLEPEVVQVVYDETTGRRKYLLREDFKYQVIEEEIRNNPKLVAKKTGIEELAYLDRLLPTRKRLSLAAIGEMYQAKKYNKRGAPISDKTKTDAKKWWADFMKIVGRSCVNDLADDDIIAYNDRIQADARKRDGWQRYIINRFNMVGTIVNNIKGEDHRKEKFRFKEMLNEHLLYPQSPKPDPRPIAVYNFLKVLKATGELDDVESVKWKAMLLLAANSGFTPIDYEYFFKNDIEWHDKVVIMDRNKTGADRMFMLWDRTIDALQEYYDTNHNRSQKYVFLQDSGKPFASNNISKYWGNTLKKMAGIEGDVCFCHIKDAVQTVPVNSYNCDAISVAYVLGHEIGTRTNAASSTKNYLLRQAQKTRPVVEAMEDYFFNDGKNGDFSYSTSLINMPD